MTRGGEVVSRLAHYYLGVLVGNHQEDYPSNSGKPLAKAEVIPNQAMKFMEGVETGWRIQHVTKVLKRDSPDHKLLYADSKSCSW